MLGSNKKVGLLVPPGNNVIENDFRKWLPDSVDLHSNVMYWDFNQHRSSEQRLLDLGDHVEESVRVLTLKPVDVVAFGCTGGSFLNGIGYDHDIASRIETASGSSRAVVTATAVVSALNHLKVERVAVCTPYDWDFEFLNGALRAFYTQAGFKIVNFAVDRRGLGEVDTGPTPHDVAVELAQRVDHPQADAVFMSCTGFLGAADVIDELENMLGKPVVTSNQATFWACMKEVGFEATIPGGGVLLAQLA